MKKSTMTENNAEPSAKEKKRAARDSKTEVIPSPEAGAKPQDLALAGVHSEARSPAKRRRGRKRVRLGDAMRRAGLDEHKVAETYVGVVEKLRNKNPGDGSVEKVLAGVLKECSRVLEPLHPSSGSGGGDPLTPIHLIHKVARPERNAKKPQGLSRSADANTEVTADTSKDVCAIAFPDRKSREESK